MLSPRTRPKCRGPHSFRGARNATLGASIPTGINNAGVVVGTSGTNGYVRDTNGAITLIGYPGAAATRFFTINNAGIVAGSYVNQTNGVFGPPQFFTYDVNTAAFKTVQLPPPYDQANLVWNPGLNYIYGINDAGAISAWINGTFLILNPDGTATVQPAAPNAQGMGALNNSGQFLESNEDFNQPYASLIDPGGAITSILWNYPNQHGAIAFGLNNGGTVVGFTGLYHAPPFVPPIAAFVRDASGIYSDLVCPSDPAADISDTAQLYLEPYAVNDNGVIAGYAGGPNFIATPLPGTAQFSSSAASLAFPTYVFGHPPAPQTFTVTNTGNARLDFASIRILGYPCCSAPDFTVSACLSNGVAVVALQPQQSCALTVAPRANPSHVGDLGDEVIFDDSAPGSPHAVPVSATATGVPPPPPPPSCVLSGSTPGPPAQATFTMTDTTSGLRNIVPLSAANVTLHFTDFSPGTTSPVIATVTQITPGQSADVFFEVNNVAGASALCSFQLAVGTSQWLGLGGRLISKIAVGANQDGRLELFGVGTDQALWHSAQTLPGGAFGPWTSLAGLYLSGDPAVGTNVNGMLEVFVTANADLLTVAQTAPGDWSNAEWHHFNAGPTGRPATGYIPSSDLQVFVRGLDNQLYHSSKVSVGSPAWNALTTLGGVILSDPAVGVNVDGRLEVFALGADQALWHISQTSINGPWGTWASLGGQFQGNPAVIGNTDGRLEVFVRGPDNTLWHIAQNTPGGDWSPWNGLGGQILSDPSPAVNASGRLEVFAPGTDHALWHIAQSTRGGSWDTWQSLGGYTINQLSPVREPDQNLDVFAVGSDTSVWHIEQSLPDSWN